MLSLETPIFVFLPGAWHTADVFDGLRSIMAERGMESEAIDIPSIGASPPDKGLHADIKFTRSALKDLIDAGRQIILVQHSYGGVVGASAMEGLGYAQRHEDGLRGGVIMAVWIAAFATPKGECLLDMLGGNWLPWMKLKSNDGYCYSSDEARIFYHDLLPEDQLKYIARIKPQPILSFTEPALHESWHDIPSMYIFCDDDKALPMPFQEAFAKRLGTSVTYHCEGSHSAFLTQPVHVIEGLLLALKAGQEQSGISAA